MIHNTFMQRLEHWFPTMSHCTIISFKNIFMEYKTTTQMFFFEPKRWSQPLIEFYLKNQSLFNFHLCYKNELFVTFHWLKKNWENLFFTIFTISYYVFSQNAIEYDNIIVKFRKKMSFYIIEKDNARKHTFQINNSSSSFQSFYCFIVSVLRN